MRFIKPLLLLVVMVMTAASAWAFTTVTTLPQGQNTKTSYMLITPRGALLAANSVSSSYVLSSIKHTSRTVDAADQSFQFLLFQSKAETTGYYIYNVSLGKFLGAFSGNDVTMTDSPSLWYVFETGKTETNQDNQVNSTRFNCADYPYCVSTSNGEVNGSAIAISNWDCTYGTRVSGSSWDGGNQYCVAEAETVSDDIWKTAYDKVVAYEANIGGGNGGGSELYPTNVLSADERAKQEASALDIINRFTKGTMDVEVILDLCRTTTGCDRYTYSASADKLTVHASSAVAACRGFYDYVKAKGAGFCSWSGNRFEKPADMACEEVSVTTAFRDHQYFNVVTYGYSLPYWDKVRWRQELDWMALHGFDMPLMLVGSEAIYRKVFKDMGLNDAQIDAWEVGPAHLPWFRMGNLAGNSFDGPLGDEWNENQRQLAHYLLEEMDKLGMKPICPAFGGFVPQAFQSVVGGTSTKVGWDWCQSKGVPNYRLSPGSQEFVEVGKRFIQAWEEEYGVCKYYLSDSFNEMTIPDAATLTQYGDRIYQTITEGSKNPEAVWVTQGWTFVWQVGDWGKTKFDALTKNVDPKRFMTLYMSPESADIKGRNKLFETYYDTNKTEWNCTYLTNMGGKNIWTGNLQKYCYGYPRELSQSSKTGNLVGYGMTMEGIECNELLNECIADAGWTNEGGVLSSQASDWMESYALARYGAYPDELKTYFNALRTSVYSNYIDAPRFGWQAANLGGGVSGGGNVTLNNTFSTGVETLFENVDVLKQCNTELLESELIEAVAQYVGNKISSRICSQIKAAKGDKVKCQALIDELQELMLNLDAALELHPIHNLKRWEDLAQKGYNADAKRNAVNARRILTVWYGNHTSDEPVQDYATRIWGGLMRDYFCPRLVNQLKAECGITGSFNRIQFENNFVNAAPALSEPRAVEGDHIEFLAALVNAAKNFGTESSNIDLKPSKQKMKITAVFPNGHEHVVYSDGTRFTAAAEAPEGAVTEFSIAHMDGTSYVLKAGDQYIHWTSGDNTTKSEDLDGLNEKYDSELNMLTIKLGNEEGLQSTTYSKEPIASLYEILGAGSNGSTFNFTLREKDDEWIAGDAGQKFFDNNYDGVGCRTSYFRVEKIGPEGPIFPISFDEDAEVTRNDRSLKSISLTQEGGETQTFDITTTKVYNDLTETAVFEVVTGSTVSGSIGYQGNWMHGYFYIDLDGNRQLTYNVDQLEQTGTEVFSYSFWSGDLNQEQSGKNSAGQTLTGNNRNTVSNNAIALPAFVAPAEGEYNVRFKVDWNSIEPAGSSVQDIIGNGGFIIDAVLKVVEASTGISQLSALNSNLSAIYDLAGRRVNAAQKGILIQNGNKVIR